MLACNDSKWKAIGSSPSLDRLPTLARDVEKLLGFRLQRHVVDRDRLIGLDRVVRRPGRTGLELRGEADLGRAAVAGNANSKAASMSRRVMAGLLIGLAGA